MRSVAARRRMHANQQALAGSRRAFNSSHPFWEEALLMRREYHSYAELAARSTAVGYPLTMQQIRLGLRYAEARLLLPGIGGTYLRRRFAEAMADFSAVDTLRYIIADVIEELEETDAVIDTEQNEAELGKLLERRDDLRELSWRWTKEYAELQDSAMMMTLDQQRLAGEQQQRQGALPPFLDRLLDDWQGRLAPPPIETVVADYGAENLRIPLPEHVDGSAWKQTSTPLDYADADEDDLYRIQTTALDVIEADAQTD